MKIKLARALEAFVQIRPQLLKKMVRRDLDVALAEDLVQETWIKLQSSHSDENIENFAGYIHRTLSNARIDHIRRERRNRELELEVHGIMAGGSDDLSPERAVIAKQTLDAVVFMLDAMPERSRRIFIMNRIRGITHKKIAEIENITEEAVYYHIRRVVERLAALRDD